MNTHYQIQIAGYLDQRWAEWFDPLTIEHQPGGQTLLSGPLRDQAELHGVLNKLRDLNLVLLAIQTLDPASRKPADNAADTFGHTNPRSGKQKTC